MLEQLNQIDQNIFFFVNKDLSNPVFDMIMPLLRNRFFWTPLYLFLTIFFVRNYQKRGWIIIIGMALTFGVTDYFSSSIIKPAVERIRPCNDPTLKAQVNIRIACGTGFSFPSSHAANHFALAIFLITIFYDKWRMIMPLAILWAFSISFAQVYVGVHYPGDILFGAIVGSMIGYVTSMILLHTKLFNTWKSGN